MTTWKGAGAMEYHFTADLQSYVDEMIASGAYASVHDLVLHALYLHRDAELNRRRKYEELKKDIALGIEQLDRGEGKPLDLDEIFAEAEKRMSSPREAG